MQETRCRHLCQIVITHGSIDHSWFHILGVTWLMDGGTSACWLRLVVRVASEYKSVPNPFLFSCCSSEGTRNGRGNGVGRRYGHLGFHPYLPFVPSRMWGVDPLLTSGGTSSRDFFSEDTWPRLPDPSRRSSRSWSCVATTHL